MNALFLLRASLPAFPLAMIALPIYMLVPKFYSENLGLSLSLIGSLLFATRLADTLLDPFLGKFSDRLVNKGITKTQIILVSIFGAGLSMTLLFSPLKDVSLTFSSLWLFLTALLSYMFFSLGTINLLGWVYQVSTSTKEELSFSSARESLGLIGVIFASATLASQNAESGISLVFLSGLIVSILFSIFFFPRIESTQHSEFQSGASFALSEFLRPLKNSRFRLLGLGYLFSAVAAAFPTTLFIFYVEDVIQKKEWIGLFLVTYFLAGALGTFFWKSLGEKWGVYKAWLLSLLGSVLLFSGAYVLKAGDEIPFLIVCFLSGLCLGGDLALPSILVNQVLNISGDRGHEGHYFGVWAFIGKLALAIAAGISLPLLDSAGYKAGAGIGLGLVSALYCLGPCLFRLLALGLLMKFQKNILTTK